MKSESTGGAGRKSGKHGTPRTLITAAPQWDRWAPHSTSPRPPFSRPPQSRTLHPKQGPLCFAQCRRMPRCCLTTAPRLTEHDTNKERKASVCLCQGVNACECDQDS